MTGARVESHLKIVPITLSLALGMGGLGLGCSKSAIDATLSNANSYYVDASLGNDANSGTSAASPWQTLSKVASTSLPSGSTVFLKRGSTWHESLLLSQSGVSIDAYGSGALPVIDGSTSFTHASTAGTLFSQAITIGSSQGLGNVSENGTMLTFIAWHTNAATTFGGASNGSFSYDYSTNTVYVLPAVTGTATYIASRQLYGIQASSVSDISLSNLQIQRFSLHGVEFKNCTRCAIKNSIIQQGGGAVVGTNPSAPPDYLYAGNGIEFGNSSSSGTVDSVTVSDIFDSCVSPQTYASSQSASSFSITNSSMNHCGFAGVEVSVLSNGGSTGSSISNITLSGLTITNSGQGWSGRRYGTEGHGVKLDVDSGAGTLSNVTLSQSTITGSAGDGIHVTGATATTQFSRLKLKGNQYGIYFVEPTSTSPKLVLSSSLIESNSNYGILYNAPNAQGLQILNNTFYGNTTVNLGILSQSGVADLRNNLFSAGAAMTHLYSASALAGATIDFNCYTDMTNAFGYNSSAYSTMSAFHSATGFESHGTAGSVGLTDPAGDDFHLSAGSACASAGTSAAMVSLDLSGNSYSMPTPSAGAYQY